MLFLKKHAMRVRVTVWLANAIPVSRPEKGSRAQSGAQLGAQSKESEVTQSLAICRLLEDAPLAAKDLLLLLGLSSKTGAFKRAIKELIDNGLIEYTIPDKPNSPLQKYRLTDQGMHSLKNPS